MRYKSIEIIVLGNTKMAFELNFELDTGGVAVYFRITHLAVDFTSTSSDVNDSEILGQAEVLLHGYVSKEARLDNKQPITVIRVKFNCSEIQGIEPDQLKALLYNTVKQRSELFADALTV